MNLRVIITISFIGTSGLGFAVIQPLLIGAIVDQLAFDREMVGWISSVNLLGIGLGGVIATLLIGKKKLHRVIQVGLLGMLLFDMLSPFAVQPHSMLGLRFIAGIFGGIVYAGALAAFSGLPDPIRAFGIYVLVYCLFGGGILVATPYILRVGGLFGGFAILAGMSLISLIGSPAIEKATQQVQQKAMISLKELLSNKTVLLALLAYCAMQMGGGTIWAFAERIGKEASLSADFTGWALGISSIVAFLGGLLVIWLGDRFGLRRSSMLGLLGMGLSIFLLFWSEIPFYFLLSISLLGGAWAFCIPYFQQMQARFDPHGKVVSLGTILNLAGRGIGPAIAAMMLGSRPFLFVVWIALGSLVLSALLVLAFRID